MDGNGRWAQMQGKNRVEGHLKGVQTVREVMDGCDKFGVEILTLYCFSSENWKRPADELDFLMALLREYLIAEREELVENNIKLRIVGKREGLPPEVLVEMDRTLDACSNNTGMTLCLAINYGARMELVDAIQQIAGEVASGELNARDITEETVSNHLYTSGLIDPDLLIRTSGEMRISNFLLWQISYAELWITDTLWPEFDRKDLAAAIRSFSNRNRRFGGLKEGHEEPSSR